MCTESLGLGADEGLHVLDQLFDSPTIPVFTVMRQAEYPSSKSDMPMWLKIGEPRQAIIEMIMG